MATKAYSRPFTIPTLPGLGLVELERRFKRVTLLMYDAAIPWSLLEEEVCRHLAPEIELEGPLLRVRGAEKYKACLRGAHRVTRFDLEVTQLHVRLNERRDGGRVIVDGLLRLRPLKLVTFPLRAVITYEFVMIEDGESFRITRHEEMWSAAGAIQSTPVLGRCHKLFRSLAGRSVAGLCRLSTDVRGRLARPRERAPARLR